MKPQVFDQGDLILASGQKNKSIYILWEGEIQVRVIHLEKDNNSETDLWFDNLKKGACFEVYNSLDDTNTSLVNYFACSRHVSVYKLDIKDLEEASKTSIGLRDRLQFIRLRIKRKHVGDIDYFKYPKRFLESRVAKINDLEFKIL